jgi:hypothetical protein
MGNEPIVGAIYHPLMGEVAINHRRGNKPRLFWKVYINPSNNRQFLSIDVGGRDTLVGEVGEKQQIMISGFRRRRIGEKDMFYLSGIPVIGTDVLVAITPFVRSEVIEDGEPQRYTNASGVIIPSSRYDRLPIRKVPTLTVKPGSTGPIVNPILKKEYHRDKAPNRSMNVWVDGNTLTDNPEDVLMTIGLNSPKDHRHFSKLAWCYDTYRK